MNTTPDKKMTPMGELYAKFNSNNTVSELFEWIYDNKERLLEAEREYASQQAPASMTHTEIEQWYHNWMAAHNKAGIATVNVLDMLKDFAAQSHSFNVPGYTDEVKKEFVAGFRIMGNKQYSLYSDGTWELKDR